MKKQTAIEAESAATSGKRVGRRDLKNLVKKDAVTWNQIFSVTDLIKMAILGALLIWLYWNEVRYMMFQTWIRNQNWSHGFIIPLFSLYFLYQRRALLSKVRRETGWLNWVGLGLIFLSIFVYLISIYPLQTGFPKLLALLMTLFGMVLFCCGWRIMKIVWLPVLYLFFAMPIPDRWYESLTIPMRIWASQITVIVLNFLPDMEADSMGVIIEGFYKGQMFTLSVAEACAGMRLMMAFVALGVAMAYLSDRPYWHRIILVLSTLPIALVCNFMRVIITSLLYILVDPIFAQGGFHTFLGLVMLPVAFVMYWGIAGILNRLYEEVEVPEGRHE